MKNHRDDASLGDPKADDASRYRFSIGRFTSSVVVTVVGTVVLFLVLESGCL